MSEKMLNELRRLGSFLRAEHNYGREQTVQDTIAEIERLTVLVERQKTALEEISEGKGRFSQDHFQHAKNTIEDMKALAVAALSSEQSRG